MGTKLLLLAVFGIAMAHFEGVVVVYLRKALGMSDSESNKESLEKFPSRYLKIEMTREAATIVMLVIIAVYSRINMAGKRGIFPLDLRILGPLLLSFTVYYNKVATNILHNRCTIPYPKTLDCTCLVSNCCFNTHHSMHPCTIYS